jgi:glycosyltransferase involved in cell wall biosynthesis
LIVRILVLGLGVPFPPHGGGLTRTYHLLKSLASQHRVTLAAFTYGEPFEEPPYALELLRVPWSWSADYLAMTGPDAAAAQRAYQRLTFEEDQPWFTSVMDAAAMEDTVTRALRSGVDLVLLEGTPTARFLPIIPAEVPRVLDFFDIHSVMADRLIASAADNRNAVARDAERTLAFERDAARRCNVCLVVSDQEAAAARALLGAGSVEVVPNGVDTAYFRPDDRPPVTDTLIFTGRMSYPPNAEAARHFAEHVLPLIRRDVPAATFHIVGAAPPPQVSVLASPSVIVHGRVDDMREHLWRAALTVVPILSGGGTRLKVLEAAACGKAIVSTPLGVEGHGFHADRDVLVAESPETFAAAVVALLRDPARRSALGRNARKAAGRFDWASIGASFRAIIERAATDRG